MMIQIPIIIVTIMLTLIMAMIVVCPGITLVDNPSEQGATTATSCC